MQQEQEQTEQLNVPNEVVFHPTICKAIVMYKRTFLIEFREYVKANWEIVTLQTLNFRYIAQTDMQQSLWGIEKKKLKKKIES